MLFSAALVALTATLAGAVPTMTVQGSNFVDSSTGKKFQIVGMAYQPGGSSGYNGNGDPLSDPAACLRDAALMQVLGINAIRVYNLDPKANHDECASIFNAAGMYMLIDVNSPLVGQSLSAYQPWTTYYAGYLEHIFSVVEAFSNYDNTLLFFSGNEDIETISDAEFVPQYLRSVTRDLKTYIKKHVKRPIPVGFSAADVRSVLFDTFNYLTCALSDTSNGNNNDISQSDLFALNSYSWCGPDATFQTSTYDQLVAGFKSTSVPVFFSEYGCIVPPPRYWNETGAIYGPDMDTTFSGAVAYQWTQDANDYGIVDVNGTTTTLLEQYDMFRDKLELINWDNIESMSPSSSTPAAPACVPSLIQEKGFNNNFTLIPVPPGGQQLIDNGVPNPPKGQFVDVTSLTVSMTVNNVDGSAINGLKVVQIPNTEFNMMGQNSGSEISNSTGSSSTTNNGSGGNSTSSGSSSGGSDDGDNAAGFLQPIVWTAALPLLAMLFV